MTAPATILEDAGREEPTFRQPCSRCAERIAFLETKLFCTQELLDYERAQRAAEREAHAVTMELIRERDGLNTIELRSAAHA